MIVEIEIGPVINWHEARPGLNSLNMSPENAIRRELDVRDIASGEYREFIEQFEAGDTEEARGELGDVLFAVLALGAVRSSGLKIQAEPTQAETDESILNLRSQLLELSFAIREGGANTLTVATNIINTIVTIANNMGWDMQQTLEDVAKKNEVNYIAPLYTLHCPFTHEKYSTEFLRLLRSLSTGALSSFRSDLWSGFKANNLWFISGHSDGNVIFEITERWLWSLICFADEPVAESAAALYDKLRTGRIPIFA